MADFIAPKGATGFRMEDGTRYDANRNGRIVVDNPAHVKAVRRASRNSGGAFSEGVVTGTLTGMSMVCGPCRFVGYAFSTTCPRCGGALTRKAPDALRTL